MGDKQMEAVYPRLKYLLEELQNDKQHQPKDKNSQKPMCPNKHKNGKQCFYWIKEIMLGCEEELLNAQIILSKKQKGSNWHLRFAKKCLGKTLVGGGLNMLIVTLINKE